MPAGAIDAAAPAQIWPVRRLRSAISNRQNHRDECRHSAPAAAAAFDSSGPGSGRALFPPRSLPRFAARKKMVQLAEVAELRARAFRRISWTALMLKAYALVAADCCWRCRSGRMSVGRGPILSKCPARSAWWRSTDMTQRGEDESLCWGRFIGSRSPIAHSACKNPLGFLKAEPIEEAFRQQMQLSRLPLLLRRAIWGWNLNSAGPKRAKRLGTFGLTAAADQGAWNRAHPTIHTTSLTYGPLDALPGAIARHADLRSLGCWGRHAGCPSDRRITRTTALNGPIARELTALAARQAPAA